MVCGPWKPIHPPRPCWTAPSSAAAPWTAASLRCLGACGCAASRRRRRQRNGARSSSYGGRGSWVVGKPGHPWLWKLNGKIGYSFHSFHNFHSCHLEIWILYLVAGDWNICYICSISWEWNYESSQLKNSNLFQRGGLTTNQPRVFYGN